MIKGKIEQGVPLPPHAKPRSTFDAEIIGFLDKLEVGGSVELELQEGNGYNFEVKARTVCRIYSIIKGCELVSKRYEGSHVFRIWRIS